MTEIPEPCLGAEQRCRSPLACSGWGYCRERNMLASLDSIAERGTSIDSAIAVRRAEAAKRKQGALGPTDHWVKLAAQSVLYRYPNLARAGDASSLAAILMSEAVVAGYTMARPVAERLMQMVLDMRKEDAATGGRDG